MIKVTLSRDLHLSFDQASGEVRVARAEHDVPGQLVFKITRQGIVVYHKLQGKEQTIPWPVLMEWAVSLFSAN